MLSIEEKLKLKHSDVTQWWAEHPNKGWEPKPPCEASTQMILLDRKVCLGDPPDRGEIKNKIPLILFEECLYWEAEHKGVRKNEIRLFNLAQTIVDRLELRITDEGKLDTVKKVFDRC